MVKNTLYVILFGKILLAGKYRFIVTRIEIGIYWELLSVIIYIYAIIIIISIMMIKFMTMMVIIML
jgi:hypothetical protein